MPVHGTIAKHLSLLETMCGGADLATIERSCTALADDAMVHSVLIDFRTPGGAAVGLPEAAAAIEALGAAGKRVVAFADEMCCSAGYWLASACGEIVATASARLGSISTLWAGVDDSAAWAAAGMRRILIATGKYKGAGVSGAPFTDDWIEEITRHVAEVDASFKGYVADRRGLAPEHMQGNTWQAASAPAGLIDRLTGSLDDALADIITPA
jgi:ClpP class serine protease